LNVNKFTHLSCQLRLGLVLILAMTLFASVQSTTTAKGEDATALVTKAAETMAGLDSFGFELSTVEGESTILRNLELVGVVGSVQRPDSFEATITAKVAIVEVSVDIIGIGSQIWVTDPLSSDKTYIDVTGSTGGSTEAQELSNLINPDRLLLAAASRVKNAVVDGTEDIDGVETTRVVGVVDLSELENMAGGTPVAGIDILTLGEMPVTLWIDGDGQLISLELEGPLTSAESPNVVRRLDLFEFNERVQIDAPENVS